MTLIDAIGYVGDTVLIAVYACLVTGRCGGHGPLYNGGKLFGYGSVCIVGAAHGAAPLMLLGALYCVLATVALVRHWRTP